MSDSNSNSNSSSIDEGIRWRCKWTLEKQREGESAPYETINGEGNLLMYGGASALWDGINGRTVTQFNNANAYIGVGDGTTAEAATQTDLQGSNKYRKGMEASYPVFTDGTTSTSATITFKVIVGTANGNFAWQEFGIFNASSSGRMLNRKVFSFGTKTSSDSWTLVVALTLS